MQITAKIIVDNGFDLLSLEKSIKKELYEQGLELQKMTLKPCRSSIYKIVYGSPIHILSYRVLGDAIDYQLVWGLQLLQSILGTFKIQGVPRTQ